MPTFETPYGTVDAPSLEAAQKWLQGRKAGGAAPATKQSAPPELTNDPYGPPGETTAGKPGWIQQMISGMSGRDVSGAGRFGMGAADLFYGGAQVGARLEQTPGGGVPEQALAPQPPPDRTAIVDKAVREREQRYEAGRKADKQTGPDWIRMMGAGVSQAPLMAAGGALPGAASRILGTAALSAGLGAAQPVAAGGQGTERAKGAGAGFVGGLIGGGIGEGVGKLASALVGHDEAGIKQLVTNQYRRLVKPGRAGGSTAPQLRTENNQILTAVDQIITEGNAAAKTTGQPPKDPESLFDFVEALDRNKRSVFAEYDAKLQDAEMQKALQPNPHMVQRFRVTGARLQQAQNAVRDAQNRVTMAAATRQRAGNNVYSNAMAMPAERQAGLQLQQAQRAARVAAQEHQAVADRMYKPYIDLAPIAQRLETMMREPRFRTLAPHEAGKIGGLAQRLRSDGSFGLAEAQDFLQAINQELKAFYRNPVSSEASLTVAKAETAGMLRQALDKTINELQGPGYNILKQRYGALRAVEREVANAYRREANKIEGGIGGIFGDLFAAEQGIGAIIHLDPGRLATALAAKTAVRFLKKLRDPNLAVQRLFATRRMQPDAANAFMAAAIRRTQPYAAPAGGLVGGQFGTTFMRKPPPRRDARVPTAGG